MPKQIIAVLIMILCLFAANTYPQELTPIAILDFKGMDVSNAVTSAITDVIKSDIVNTGLFKVLERQQIDAIIKEQGFQQTGCTEQSCAVEIGKLVSAKKILIGTVSKVGQSFIITAHLVDVTNGIVEYSVKETAFSEDILISAASVLTRKLIIQIKGESTPKELLKLPAPDWIKVSYGTSYSNITIEWAKVPETNNYHIYRSLYQDKEFVEIAKVNLTTYYDYAVRPGIVYFYKILAESSHGYGILSNADSGFIKLNSPDSIKISLDDKDNIQIEWKVVKGAEKYFIYKASITDSEYKEIDNVKSTSYTDSKALPGEKAWYKIRAWASTGFSDYSNPVQGYRLSEKEVKISNAKFGYYARGFVPGWGQYYSGRTIKGLLYGSVFVASCINMVYAQTNYNNAKSDYDNIKVEASDSETKKIRKDYEDAAKYAKISLGLVAAFYVFNLVDIFFINRPDFSKDISMLQTENTYFSFNINNPYYNTKEQQFNVCFNIKF